MNYNPITIIPIRTSYVEETPKTGFKYRYPMLSEFIEDLQNILKEYGDYPIKNYESEYTDEINEVCLRRPCEDSEEGSFYSIEYDTLPNKEENE